MGASRPGESSVTVVIPAYNAEGTLARALESVLRQSRPPEEIIVVDDGSTDATPAVAASFAPDVRVLRQENAGASQARNAGARAAAGSLLAFLDADDEWHPRKLEIQIGVLHAHPDVAFCACLCREASARRTSAEQRDIDPAPSVRLLSDFRDVFRNPYFGTPSIVMPKSIFDVCGGFNPSLPVGEDLDLWLRAAYGRTVSVVDAVLVHVHRTPGSLTLSARWNTYEQNLRIIDAFCRDHEEFADNSRGLVSEVRAMVLTDWASERISLGEYRLARTLLWKSLRTRLSYRASYLFAKATLRL